jgi:subtilisin family serine protease
MRTFCRAIVTSVTASLLAFGGISAAGARAAEKPADQPAGSRHIVVLRADAGDPDAAARDHGRKYGAMVEYVYHNALKGYVATFKGNGAAEVAHDPGVDFVEVDRPVSVHGQQAIPAGGPWGLDRIDQHNRPLDGVYRYTSTGAGVTAYIIDTGIRSSHQEFGNRVTAAPNRFDAFADGRNAEDCDGHGTHVAATVGGTTYGVAKAVTLTPVRVLDCTGSGSYSGVIRGIDWVTGHHAAGAPAVANMSLGGPASAALDAAINNSIADGVTYAVAAGNGNAGGKAQDACKYSPARVPAALTIGAVDRNDVKASWSNAGQCVDWFAPGVSILSAGIAGDTSTATMSGTSMATPHTTGAVAQYLQGHPGSTPAQVRAGLFGVLSADKVASAGKGTVNDHILFTDF